MSDVIGLRAQILANAEMMVVRAPGSPAPITLPSLNSIATMVSPSNANAISTPKNDIAISTPKNDKLDVVIFGAGNEFTAAIMLGITPAIEGSSGTTPEASLRKLLLATCELLDGFMPKVGSHQRNIHGGGVFDEDTISVELLRAQKKSP